MLPRTSLLLACIFASACITDEALEESATSDDIVMSANEGNVQGASNAMSPARSDTTTSKACRDVIALCWGEHPRGRACDSALETACLEDGETTP